METIRKTISNEIRKWNSIDMQLFVINDRISSCYNILIIGDYDSKKNFFNILHYLKMKRDYIFIKFYHNNIKKTSHNEKLLHYLESILLANGFDLSRL